MGVFDNFKSKTFWIEVLKLSVIFFIVFVALSLLISNFSNILSGNWSAVYEQEWANGKWKRDLSIKAAITIVYAIYMTSRRQKAEKRTNN